MNRSILALALLGVCLLSLGNGVLSQEKAGDITLQVVKYDGLKQAVLQNRGKVVLVDFWDTL